MLLTLLTIRELYYDAATGRPVASADYENGGTSLGTAFEDCSSYDPTFSLAAGSTNCETVDNPCSLDIPGFDAGRLDAGLAPLDAAPFD